MKLDVKEYVENKKDELQDIILAEHLKPSVNIVQFGNLEASNRYVRNKFSDCDEIGITANLYKFAQAASKHEILKFFPKDGTTPLIIQLPVRNDNITEEELQNEFLNPYNDIDGILPNSKSTPCTAKGVVDYLTYLLDTLDGLTALVIGRGKISGAPIAKLLLDKGCTVIHAHSRTPSHVLDQMGQEADIIVSAVGQRNFVDRNMISRTKKQVLIDVGINFDENGKMCGDADPAIYSSDLLDYTPVPGGVGLLTRVALMENVINRSPVVSKIAACVDLYGEAPQYLRGRMEED